MTSESISQASGTTGSKVNLVGMTRDEMVQIALEEGLPAFRGRQIYEWVYRHGAKSIEAMTTLARPLREKLTEKYTIELPTVAEIKGSKEDGSRKIVMQLRDGERIESVLMEDKDWQTLCVSSQVGCAVDCKFCMTGFGGFRRQMTASEIVAQYLVARFDVNDGVAPRNMVFMGMGEPMLNLDQVIPAIRLLTDPEGMSVSSRRITVSTSGIIPGIRRLGESDTGVNIAISLNASNNEFRSRIMPINKKYPIEDLLDACHEFPLKHRRRITFEYVLLGGENDSPEDARRLAELLRGMPCKVNIIPWNPDPHLPYQRPDEASIRKFQQVLSGHYLTASVRYSKGLDIGAACGQLAGHSQTT